MPQENGNEGGRIATVPRLPSLPFFKGHWVTPRLSQPEHFPASPWVTPPFELRRWRIQSQHSASSSFRMDCGCLCLTALERVWGSKPAGLTGWTMVRQMCSRFWFHDSPGICPACRGQLHSNGERNLAGLFLLGLTVYFYRNEQPRVCPPLCAVPQIHKKTPCPMVRKILWPGSPA